MKKYINVNIFYLWFRRLPVKENTTWPSNGPGLEKSYQGLAASLGSCLGRGLGSDTNFISAARHGSVKFAKTGPMNGPIMGHEWANVNAKSHFFYLKI